MLFRVDGKQSSLSFDDHAKAVRFRDLINQVGPTKALEVIAVTERKGSLLTVEEWISHHIDHLTGVEPATVRRYRSYLANDIAPVLGVMPLAALSREDIALWVNAMQEEGASGKTIANKQRFLSGAMNAAVAGGHITTNPCRGLRLPRWERREMVFLTESEFAILLNAVTEYWRPLVTFLVASGARWSEATALRPDDVDRAQGTVRISRAWKANDEGVRLGPPKSAKSVRTINVADNVLANLDYTGEWLFTNRAGDYVRAQGFTRRVWAPAVKRAALGKVPRIHDLRHTCASWMIADNVPLAVVQHHLGHESIETTVGTYGHLDRRSARAAANAISARLEVGVVPTL
ncbi:tyrosine-type recombinase/integrase [Mycobacterium asiaticum]|uniref:tyrosine-type recombinase/integrase n=1 Tax=Mycobacterium asiaticum TaxID=1790 RepID=UPI00313FE28B